MDSFDKLMAAVQVGEYVYYGTLDPANENPESSRWDTFSVAVFKVEPTKDGKGKKRGKTVTRIGGITGDPEYVYRRAIAVCGTLNQRRPTSFEEAKAIAADVKRLTVERLPW